MISIAMATYNGAKYIPLQVESILQQTIHDIEIIICDDCSTDGSWEIIQNYASKDSRIKPFRNEINLGHKKNFEKAMTLCTGELIALSDQDDIWTKDHLEVLLNILGDHSIACGNANIIGSDGESLGMNLNDLNYFETIPNSKNLDIAYRVFFNSNCFQGASMLIKRDFLKMALPIPEKAKYHDAWFVALAPFLDGLIYTDRIITAHRRHGKNASKPVEWEKIGPIYYRQAPHLNDRPFWGIAIEERVKNLTGEQKKFLKSVKKYYTRRLARTRKTKNFFFRLPHYKKIYTTTSRIYLEW